ncbi:LPS export ABC transporter permease LptG [Congregibacter litoralis]|uniref:Putative permease n=1 Tax=Congregibacter litoralis KT71 TaxID=314285 RepID=A4A3Y1_9GAMM|nr:LPS export ABC transporter permease LptG [Congregibacter litoralis]EAQ99404.1 putative permease [Congregibacter litoralis KT71]
MRKLNRYVARTVWLSILLVLLVIVGIDGLSAFIDESDSRSASYGFAEIGRYVMLTMPRRVYEFIPFAALIGALIGLGQLASTSELVVMRAAGISNGRLAWMVLKQALVIAVFGFLLGEYIAPKAEQQAQSGRAIARYAGRQVDTEQGIWRRDGAVFFHVQAIAPDNEVFGVTAYEFEEDGWMQRALFADSGRYDGEGWRLRDVQSSEFSRDRVRKASAPALFLPSNITPKILSLENVAPSQLTLVDLVDYAAFLRSQGEDVADFELATWRKLMQPAAVAALVLIAISFVFGPLRDGTLGFRIFAGVMVGILFQLSQDLLGPASLVFGFPPLYAALAPVLSCVLVGLYLLRKA